MNCLKNRQLLKTKFFAQIRIEIINDDRYEKSEDFYVQLGQPVWESGLMQSTIPTKKEKIVCGQADSKSQFFSSPGHLQLAPAIPGSFKRLWRTKRKLVISDQKFMHFLCLPWKLLFACIPPTDYAHGWVCFCVAIIFIGLLTAVIGDVAAMFGCTIGLKDTVTAITLVALGTSIPDTFASKLAAVQDKTADSSIGNVTGSNAVNVFLGIGVAWAIAAIYHAKQGTVFHVHAGSLATSVALFLMGSVICISILQIRRFSKSVHAELGGPAKCKWMSSIAFFFTWIVYITYCTLDAYCVI
uniref:Sodium/calcium exchanger membrane region domain-containing protein n=1 Tax=Ditylenchus dipsaci TaxID=166011 RepID=A0A915DSA0_9BILA